MEEPSLTTLNPRED